MSIRFSKLAARTAPPAAMILQPRREARAELLLAKRIERRALAGRSEVESEPLARPRPSSTMAAAQSPRGIPAARAACAVSPLHSTSRTCASTAATRAVRADFGQPRRRELFTNSSARRAAAPAPARVRTPRPQACTRRGRASTRPQTAPAAGPAAAAK
jgi:hypothetical protein